MGLMSSATGLLHKKTNRKPMATMMTATIAYVSHFEARDSSPLADPLGKRGEVDIPSHIL